MVELTPTPEPCSTLILLLITPATGLTAHPTPVWRFQDSSPTPPTKPPTHDRGFSRAPRRVPLGARAPQGFGGLEPPTLSPVQGGRVPWAAAAGALAISRDERRPVPPPPRPGFGRGPGSLVSLRLRERGGGHGQPRFRPLSHLAMVGEGVSPSWLARAAASCLAPARWLRVDSCPGASDAPVAYRAPSPAQATPGPARRLRAGRSRGGTSETRSYHLSVGDGVDGRHRPRFRTTSPARLPGRDVD